MLHSIIMDSIKEYNIDCSIVVRNLKTGEEARINEACSKQMIDIMKSQLLVADVHRYIPDDIGLALKTGDIWGYKHAAGIFYIDSCDYIFTMLINYTDDKLIYADEFMGKMSAAVYNYFNRNC